MTTPAPVSPNVQRETIRFFALAYGLAWVLWIPMAILAPSRSLVLPVVLLGAFGPSVAAFLLSDRAGRRDLVARFVQLGRIPLVWWVVLLAFHPAVALASNWIAVKLGGAPVTIDRTPFATPASILGWLLIMILGGPLAEEFGWRGYAQDRLQAIGGPFNASIALGILWAMWHLPLFFIPGTSQAAMGFGSWLFWLWTTQVIFQTLVYTWIYNRTGRSIFAAVLFHLLHNATFSILAGIGGRLPTEYEIGATIVSIVAGLAAAVAWRVRSISAGATS